MLRMLSVRDAVPQGANRMYRMFRSDNAMQDGSRVSRHRVPPTPRKAGLRFPAVRHLSNSALLLLCLGLAPGILCGQITNVTNGQQVPTPGVGHDYIGTISEVVTPANGSLSIRIPLPTPPGRGITLPLQFTYNSNGIIQVNSVTSNNDTRFLEQGGWGLGLPLLTSQIAHVPGNNPQHPEATCPIYGGFVFTDPSGSRHSMRIALPNYGVCNATGVGPGYSMSLVDQAYDGSYFIWTPASLTGDNNAQALPFSVSDNDGLYYHFPYLLALTGCIGACNVPDYIEDRNGNKIQFNFASGGGTLPLTITDTAGRPVMSINSFTSSSGDTISVSGVTNPYTLTWESVPYNLTVPTTLLNSSTCNETLPPTSTSGTMRVVKSVTLPDGQTYQFGYDPTYGLVNQITYPTGAVVAYTWGPSTQPSDAFYYDYVAGAAQCAAIYEAPAILQRSVSINGTIVQHQTFTYATNFNGTSRWTAKQTSVTTTDRTRAGNPSYTTNYNYSFVDIGPLPDVEVSNVAWQSPVEHTTLYNDVNGQLLQTTTKTWSGQAINPVLAEQDTTLPNGQVARTVYQRDAYNNVTEKDEYDYGQSSQTRSTVNSYQAFAGRTLLHTFPTAIVDKPCKTVVYAGTTDTGTRVAETDVEYDGGTTVCGASGTPAVAGVNPALPPGTHDDANFGMGGTSARGNLTTNIKWASMGSASPTTTYTYDVTGQIVSMTDPCGNLACSDMTGTGHTTTYSYTDSPANPNGNSDAYLTQFTTPNTGVAHIQSYQYDYPSGDLIQTQDQNNVTTKYSYNDPLNRPTLVDNAAHAVNQFGQPADRMTSFSYPSATEVDVAQDDYTPGDAELTSSTFSDGLGRPIKAIGRDGSVVETAYDAFNRVCAVSNPTFNDPGPLSCVASNNPGPISATDGITYITYDALGRKTLQTQPDGNTLQWIPIGNVVDFYDEDGSHWQRTSDAFGRLTKVLENDPAGSRALTLETDYTYDPLDNLTSVNQKGAPGDTARYRTFLYDSLSQLTNACNPEAIATGSSCTSSGPWSVIYSYDANGNVSKRTDARGIVTNYSYDALNRITGKRYTNDPANTPALSYSYDTEYSWQVLPYENRPVGHLNGITATVGTTNVVAWASRDYDQRGNLTGYFTCLGSNVQTCGTKVVDGELIPTASGTAAIIAYDLNDSVTDFWAVSGNATLSQSFGSSYFHDNAGRLYKISTEVGPNYSSNGGYVFGRDVLDGATFYPGGAVKTANLAIDPVTNVFPQISLSRTFDNRGRLTGETDVNSQQQTVYNYSVNYDGNGNVTGYNDSAAGTWTVNNDAIHRLLNMSGTFGGVASTAHETYDHFGNRNVETVTAGSDQIQPSSYLHFTAGNNRADEGIYDNAGNPFSDGTNNYLYDAENRICAVQQIAAGGGGSLIGYLYAPDGTRLGKANLTSFSCDMTQNGMLTANGPVLTNFYTVGPQGEQLLETDGNFNLTHFNVFWEGKVLGSYSGTPYADSNWHFALHDWVGTKRVITNSDGTYSASFFNGPFGDFQTPSGNGSDPSEHHFTGKERDVESGLDYFPARYYNSNLGRFLSPDPSNLSVDWWLPQTWNRYSYGLNNPLAMIDKNGLWPVWTHNNIIDEAFPGMSKTDLQNLKDSSYVMDAGAGQQLPSNSYMHGMSDGGGTVFWGGEGGNAVHDRIAADNYIDSQVQTAQEAQANWIAQGHSGFSPLALSAFGNALHTTEDRLSPAHAGEQPWANNPWWHYTTINHFFTEAWRTRSDVTATDSAARSLFSRTFGNRFDWVFFKKPCARTSATDFQGNTTGWSGCQ